MEQPEHDLRSHAPTTAEASGTRGVSLLVVGAIHVGLAFALIAGLKSGMLDKLPDELKAEVVQPKDEVKPPPPPPPDLASRCRPSCRLPEINIANDAPVNNAITAVQNVAPTLPIPAPPAGAGADAVQGGWFAHRLHPRTIPTRRAA